MRTCATGTVCGLSSAASPRKYWDSIKNGNVRPTDTQLRVKLELKCLGVSRGPTRQSQYGVRYNRLFFWHALSRDRQFIWKHSCPIKTMCRNCEGLTLSIIGARPDKVRGRNRPWGLTGQGKCTNLALNRMAC
ncbi:hypothetical protein FVE85_9859 [Porphyridium purpureum]|uniref:Uncharacterized protein n=1 Tax=Porphyridium purpureum TaxID=35688 RepID=A0A5J4YKC6_PORPP|nr:hypothetical protein FVE85_9859 [Porphyridium purpureum]|eukprot:POR6587..scf289_17